MCEAHLNIAPRARVCVCAWSTIATCYILRYATAAARHSTVGDTGVTGCGVLKTVYCVEESGQLATAYSMVGAKVCGALVRRRGRTVLALLLLGVLLGVRVPLSATDSIDFPHHTPAELAHFLADFSNHHRLDETIGAWWVEGEAGNYTWWQYEVGYECGARCTGRAQLTALSEHGDSGPRHGAAHRHRLHLADTRCRTPPLLPWPAICDKTEVEMSVEPLAGRAGDASGARLVRAARGACGLPAALAGGCWLYDRLRAHGRALRAALR